MSKLLLQKLKHIKGLPYNQYREIKKTIAKINSDLKQINSYPVDFISLQSVDYDLYWQDKRPNSLGQLSKFQQNRADVVAEMIEDASSVIDLGCGDGAILSYLCNKKKIAGIGVDGSQLVLNYVASKGFSTYHKDLTNIDSLSTLPEVDYILALEVIEHIPEPEKFLSVLETKCRKAFILSIPNTGYYTHRLRLLVGRFPLQWRLHPGEHVRFWTVKDAKWWIGAIGRQLSSLVLYEGIPGLNRLIPGWFAQGIILKIDNTKHFTRSSSKK